MHKEGIGFCSGYYCCNARTGIYLETIALLFSFDHLICSHGRSSTLLMIVMSDFFAFL